MDKKYAHLCTFLKQDGGYVSKVMITKESIPTMSEWNGFIDILVKNESLKAESFVLINSMVGFAYE